MSFISDKEQIRVRFAPSPTGFLHVGNARTAIFNWLFARKYGGAFLLRIEDTDVARSGEDMVKAIFDGLKWLDLDWDEEIVYQSKRLAIYDKHIEALISERKAYKCFCSKEVLDEQRNAAKREKRDYRYRDRRECFRLSRQEVLDREKAGQNSVVRLVMPSGETVFEDAVYGTIKVNHEQLDDFIIRRSDGYPTYHLAVVVDDHHMGVTHVIRGDDHLSNTPKHILIYQALGWHPPKYGHAPMILGADKQRLSKRHGATAVGEYKEAGYLADAVLNFLTLLGWSSGDDRELFDRDNLVAAFSVDGISRKSAVFDEQKLEWMNGQYLNALSNEEFTSLMIQRQLAAGMFSDDFPKRDPDYLSGIAALIKSRIKLLSEIPMATAYFFEDPASYDIKAIKKHWKSEDQVERFEHLGQRLEQLDTFDVPGIEVVMREYAADLDVGAGKVIQPVRIALTGIAATPGMFEIMELLGKETVLRRLRKASAFLRENPIRSAETAI